MDLPNPIPATYVALWLVVPGVAAFGRWLAAKASDDKPLAALVAPAFAFGAALGAVHVASYALGSFHLGLLVGLVAVGGAGYALHPRRLAAGARRAAPPDLRTWRLPLLALALSLCLVVPLAFGWAFGDEVQLFGHLSTIAQLQNDVYPPRYPTFPTWELRYHYGFDVAAAALTALLRVRPSVAIDLVTVGGWSYLWVLLVGMGRRVSGHDAGWIAAPLALLGGGFTALCTSVPADCARCQAAAACGVGDELVNGPFLSYLFQHPWGVGLPLAVALLLVTMERETPPRPSRAAALALVAFGLTQSQFAIYLAVLATVVFAAMVDRGAGAKRTALAAAALGLGVLAALPFGGFFAATPSDAGLLAWSPGITGAGLAGELRWFGASFGLLLPLGLIGLATVQRSRWVLTPMALGGLLPLLLFSWGELKWDLFKFATLSQVFLGVGAGVALAGLWAAGPPGWRHGGAPGVRRFSSRAVAAALALATMWGGASFAIPFLELLWLGERDAALEVRFARTHPTTTGDDRDALLWLRARVQPGELVYRTDFEASFAYQIHGGISVPWTENRAAIFGFDDARMQAREALFDVRPARFEALRDEGIVWFVVAPSDPPALQAAMQAWTSDGRAAVLARIGALTIVRLRPR